MLNPKYKISNLAKDIGVKGKVITDILENNGRGVKSTSAVLNSEDFDIVLNELSLANQISDFNDYMEKKSVIPSVNAQKAEVKAEKKEEKKEEKPLEVKQEPEKEVKSEKTPEKKEDKPEKKVQEKTAVKEEKKAEKKPEQKPEKKEEPKAVQPKAEKKEEVKNVQPKSDKKKQPAQARPHMQTVTLPKKYNENDNKTPTQPIDSASRSPKTQVRVVDTRSSSVDLSKYDEKLDRYASDKDYGNSKQKLKKQNQRSPQGKKDKASKEKQAMDKLRRQQEMAKKQVLYVSLPEEITVSELAARLKLKAVEVVKKLMMLGVMATVNETVDYDTAYLIADEMGAKITKEANVSIEEQIFDTEEDNENDLITRPPVVCVMGHVDHGKTSLLDAIRHTSVTRGEAGGITQHIGAYTVDIDGNAITFLDTPGHEAFTTMRARGAMATDIAVLVVAADDGIMPQTVEAINHAKAAGVDIIVAINKMDKPTANPDNVKQELTQYELVPEEWGGDVICVPVSAVTGMGIEDLLENILLIAEVKEFKANPNRHAKGVIIEAKLDKGRGPVATVLVQNGTLHAGDVVIAGTSVGHVRAMTDDKGKQVKTAGPSVPVEIIGLSEVPSAGDEFNAVEDEKKARELAEQRRDKAKNEIFKANSAVSLDDLFAAISDGAKTLNIIVKADVRGSAEAVKQSLEKLSNDEVKVKIILTGVGGIIESDVMLAAASNAIIVGFNVRPDKNAIDIAERQGIDIRTYRIIYECIEEITAAMKGMLAPTYKEERLGQAEVRATIRVPNVGTIAGSYVQDGKILRSAQIRVVRDGVIIFEDKISSLRRFKDDVKEVASGYECGIGLDKFNDIKEGDILEAFRMVEVER
ncbi:MAG: translation initiation factor IF-2 [Clostridia bacterium]|nr:translation initiation factor IF-2 [Clostridia bacterium]